MSKDFLSRVFLVLALFGLAGQVHAASPEEEQAAVAKAVGLYLTGTSFNVQADINKAFYPAARLYLDGPDNTVREVSAVEYAKFFPTDKQSQFNGRIGRLISIDVSGVVATAKAEIVMPKQGWRFVDVFLLRKVDGDWKIMSKSAFRADAAQHGRKVLFVLSNAAQYPGTKINTGNNFPELAYTYDAFIKAGYAVDFTSPQGGPVPLEMIVTSDAMQRRHVYDRDFMWSLANTRAAADIKAADYAGIVYVGGGAATIGIADNSAIQQLARQIYEDQGGVIAAICHGTEGISRLKLRDGSLLIRGKVLTSYPDVYLNKESPIFKAYPLSVEESIKRSGGKFAYGAKDSSHVEVDGRLVTGMNWESSVGVADAMIRLLEAKK
jgi:putative intracellular protease/amidase